MFRGGLQAALALTLVAAGCGKEIVAGGERDVEAVATGDGSPQSSARSSAGALHALVPLGGSRASLAAQPQGTLSFDARVSLVGADGEVVPLTRAGAGAQVRIEGTDTALIARGRVRATSYARARVVFTRVTANVTGGLTTPLGVSITGTVSVGIAPGDSVVVEAPVALPASGKQTLVVDLDASDWLTASVGGVVPAAVFRSAVDLRVR